jgi:cytochrome b subunit of formate dehydrogenase
MDGERIERHKGVDRLFHWLTALSVLTLLITGLLPVVGVKFDWVPIHWMTGVVLLVLVLFHLVRSVIWQKLKCMWIGARDFSKRKYGKYSPAQKLMHLAMTLVILSVVVTGVLMMAKVDTPFWERNPYMLSASTWGYVYVLHGAAALLTVTLVIIHVYFGLIPENRMYLRAMIKGWVTREELAVRHEWTGNK